MQFFNYEADFMKDTMKESGQQRQVSDQQRHTNDSNRRHPPYDHNRHDGHHNHKGNDGRIPGGPPPNVKPQYSKSAGVYAIDPGAINNCLYNYTYVWLSNGRSFWFYPTFVGRKSVSGYRWSRFGWSYIGLDLNLIDFFSCSRY